MITLALRSCLSPHIGRSLALRLPSSHSTRLLASRSVRCHAAGSSSPSTAGYTGALSVVTSMGVTLVAPLARSKNRRAAAASRHGDTNTSMTWPNWSIARSTYASGRPPSHRSRRVPSGHRRHGGRAGVGKQRRKPLDPPVDGDVVDLDAALGEQLLHVAVRQREAQIPPHGQHDHVWRKRNPTNAYRATGAGRKRRVLMATVCPLWARSQQVQQCPSGYRAEVWREPAGQRLHASLRTLHRAATTAEHAQR